MAASRRPEDIFTPKTIVAREMFARRNEPDLQGNPGLQDILTEALRERGGQVLIYGDTGVGKSSLLKYVAEDEGWKMVTVECLSSKNYEDLIEDGIRKLVDLREQRRTTSTSAGAAAEGTIGKLLLTLKGTIKAEFGVSGDFEVVRKPPLDALLAAMRAADARLLVFDNFQNVDGDRTRALVAQTMEFMSDRAGSTGDIKTVVVGIAEDASALIGGSGSFQRRTTEVGVPRMPDDEIRQILETGFRLLDLRVEPTALEEMVFYSDGFPFFAHLLGLQTSRRARAGKVHIVDSAIVEASLARVAQGVDRTFADKAALAVEAGGEVQPRRRILSMFARSGQREWRSQDVITAYTEAYGGRGDYAFLHVALAQLTQPKHGSVLRRRGTRGRYVYRFADPHLRPYLRIAHAADDTDYAGSES